MQHAAPPCAGPHGGAAAVALRAPMALCVLFALLGSLSICEGALLTTFGRARISLEKS